ncbi:hypothetical protein BDN72DRAFT_958206 [Pluteus cervinus]|uniref:Uncharacterized protein n=1 Tax=Pluteus cervinus TaxID=181527 RepID=A0ACD3AZU6_9AGAR|nr:hypothetical protein BDN72DRAFT_958206 [Pluteus cervinus]
MTFDHFLMLMEEAYSAGSQDLKSWLLRVVLHLVQPNTGLLQSATNEEFYFLSNLAVRYQHPRLSHHVQRWWMTRIMWGQLSPLTAIGAAQQHGFQELAGVAYYAQLCSSLEGTSPSREECVQEIDAECRVDMLPKQTTHLINGFYSLWTRWRMLSENSPVLPQGEGCTCHNLCVDNWKARWLAMVHRNWSIPEFDILRRLQEMSQMVKGDVLLGRALSPQCLVKANAVMTDLRNKVTRELPHHFDLD